MADRGRPALRRPCRDPQERLYRQPPEELFRAAHDIKGDAATFGYPSAAPPPKACAGSSSTRPTSTRCRRELIVHHINAIQAIVRDHTKLDTAQSLRRAEPATARRRRRISAARQPRPPRASRSDPGPEHRAGGEPSLDGYIVIARSVSTEAIERASKIPDCFAEPLFEPRRARTRWLAIKLATPRSDRDRAAGVVRYLVAEHPGFFPRRLGRKAAQQDQ